MGMVLPQEAVLLCFRGDLQWRSGSVLWLIKRFHRSALTEELVLYDQIM